MKVAKLLCMPWLFGCLAFFAAGQEEKRASIEVSIRPGLLKETETSRPREVFVYQIIPGDARLWTRRIVQLVDIKGETKEDDELVSVKEGKRYLEVRKASNSAFYGDMDRLWSDEPSPTKTEFQVPDNDAAQSIAQDWIRKFGFSEERARGLEISISDEIFELTLPGKEAGPVTVVVGKNIEVRRRIDGLLVYGPGSKIKFYVGEEGGVNAFMAVWRQVLPDSTVLGHEPSDREPKGEKVEPITSREAFEALKKNPLDHLPLALVHKIHVDKAAFGYYARSAVERQKYLQPVYVFSGTAYAKLPDGKEVSTPYEQYVVALEKPFEPIWPETQDFKAEPRREREPPTRQEDIDEEGGY